MGYWEDVPERPDAPVIIVAAELQSRLNERLRDDYQVNSYGLRAPSVVLWLYIERNLWDRYVDLRLRPQNPAAEAPEP